MSSAEPILFFAKHSVRVPQQSKIAQAGKDIFFCEDIQLQPREKKKINCKVGANVPQGHFGLIVPRSSVHELWINVHLGILDGYFVDEIKISLTNECFSTQYTFEKGTSLAQLIFVPNHLGPSILAHPDQVQFRHDQGKFPSGSSGNKGYTAIQVEPKFREKYPHAKCPTCGHCPDTGPNGVQSNGENIAASSGALCDRFEQLRVAQE